jgi:hypothetical protein
MRDLKEIFKIKGVGGGGRHERSGSDHYATDNKEDRIGIYPALRSPDIPLYLPGLCHHPQVIPAYFHWRYISVTRFCRQGFSVFL